MNAMPDKHYAAAVDAWRAGDAERAIAMFRGLPAPMPPLAALHCACLMAVQGDIRGALAILRGADTRGRTIAQDDVAPIHSCRLLEDILAVIDEGRDLSALHFRKRNRLINLVYRLLQPAIGLLGWTGGIFQKLGFPDGATLRKISADFSAQCWIYGMPARPAFFAEPLDLAGMAGFDSMPEAYRKSVVAYLAHWTRQGHAMHNLMRAIVKPGDAHALYCLVRQHRPRTIVEIGTFTGFSTSLLAQAVQANGGGLIHCFDPNLTHVEVENPLGQAQRLWEEMGLRSLIKVHEGFFSDPQEPAIVGPPVHGGNAKDMLPPVDFAFVDGSHATVDVVADFRLLLPALADEAVVVLHDVRSWHSVRKAIELIVTDEVWSRWIRYHDVTPGGLDGVGVITFSRKPGAATAAAAAGIAATADAGAPATADAGAPATADAGAPPTRPAPAAAAVRAKGSGKPRLCVLGLDGMSWPIFDLFAERLPNLQRIRAEGAWADLETVNPPVTAPAWVSFQTAQSVGNHGVTSFEQYDEDFRYSLRDGSTLDAITYYEILDQFGYRQMLINVPYSNPARISGDIVHSWLTYRPRPEEMVEPAGLLDEFPGLRPYLAFDSFSPEGSRRFFEEVVSYTEMQFDVLREGMARKGYDAVFCLNSATDGLQHAAYQDIRDRRRDSAGFRAMGKTLETIDRFAGWLMREDPECHMVLASDHGFQTYQGSFYVNQFLEQEGYLRYSATGSAIGQAHPSGGVIVGPLLIWLRHHPRLLGVLKSFYARFLKRLVKFEYRDVIDVEHTVGYMPSAAEMMIHLRLKPPLGPADGERIAAEIIRRINGLGLPVTAVSAREFFGDARALGRIPPVILHSDRVFMRKDIGADIYRPEEVHAWHSRRGIFAGHGPAFRHGVRLDDMHITDVVPTLFAALGVPLSDSFDGRVRSQALARQPAAEVRNYPRQAPGDYEMTAEEREKVARRLRDLGYL